MDSSAGNRKRRVQRQLRLPARQETANPLTMISNRIRKRRQRSNNFGASRMLTRSEHGDGRYRENGGFQEKAASERNAHGFRLCVGTTGFQRGDGRAG